MTPQDYILIAEALHVSFQNAKSDYARTLNPHTDKPIRYDEGRVDGIAEAASRLADSFMRDNPDFDGGRFLATVRGEQMQRDVSQVLGVPYREGREVINGRGNINVQVCSPTSLRLSGHMFYLTLDQLKRIKAAVPELFEVSR